MGATNARAAKWRYQASGKSLTVTSGIPIFADTSSVQRRGRHLIARVWARGSEPTNDVEEAPVKPLDAMRSAAAVIERDECVTKSDRSSPWSLLDSGLGKLVKSFADLGPRVCACVGYKRRARPATQRYCLLCRLTESGGRHVRTLGKA
jgi:hypothetical protein